MFLGERGRTHTFVVMHDPAACDASMRALLARHRVTVVLCGHLHKTQELARDGFTIYVSPGTAKFRDGNGLGYRIFRVGRDRVDQEFVPLEKEVGAPSG